MTSNTPRAHRFYLKKTRYPLRKDVIKRVTPREEEILDRYGHWLDALAKGVIPPCTEEQQRFVMAARGFRVPQSRFEIAWAKTLTAR